MDNKMATCAATIPDTENVPHQPEISIQGNTTEDSTVDVDLNIPEQRGRKSMAYNPEYANIACRLAAAGFTEQNIAYALGISLSLVRGWKARVPEFKAACETGRVEVKKLLIATGMRQALGYKYTERNIKRTMDSDGSVIKQEESEFQKEMPGNERMLVFMLMNLDRQLKDKEWENINKIEVDESKTIKINIDGKSAKEQIARLSGELLEQG
jgi:hypothetical protein